MFPWSRADFRHHVLRLVREHVPAIMEELHTIVDLSDPDEIRRDIDACATRWQREKPWITRTMHLTVRVWRQAPAMRASRQWAPVFLRTAGGTGVRGDAEQSPSIEDSRRRPRARSQRPRCSTGGSGTTCGTKDTRPSRVTQLVRPPSVSPSVGLHMRSIVPSARAALGVLGHARSDVHELYQLPKSARPLHLHPCYDGAPVQDFAVCWLDADGSRALATLRWGLVPSWAKDLRRGARLVNARAETVHDTPSFSTAFRARRCLVPANGWFEWQRTGHAKQPYFLARADGSPLSFAARWEGIVRLRVQVAKWPDDEPGAELPRIPLPARDHQLRRVAVLPIRPEFPGRGGSARPAARDGYL